MHSIDKHGPWLVQSLLALKKQFENSRLKNAENDPEVLITEIEDIYNQMDEIGLTSHMSYDDLMLHVMGNVSKEYEAVLAWK